MRNTQLRTVSFNRSVRCKTFATYTSDVVASVWYNKDELKNITNRCFLLLKKAENGGSKTGRTYCMRGLEGYSTLGSATRKKNRSNALLAVLEEQQRQLVDHGYIDANEIANVYKRSTAQCQLCALFMAKRDHLETQRNTSTTTLLATNIKNSKNDFNTCGLAYVGRSRQKKVGLASGIIYERKLRNARRTG